MVEVRNQDKLGRVLDGLTRELPVAPAPEFKHLVNWAEARNVPIHRWFRYREGFSPELISRLRLGPRVLDPFCGCGSIMVGAAQAGLVSVGIDVNPLSIFVADVKLTPLTSDELNQATGFVHSLRDALRQTSPWPEPDLRIAKKVFEPLILDTLLRLRSGIETWMEQPRPRAFLLLAWLSILQDVGSYFKEGNGIKYRNRKRLPSGYVRRQEGEWQLERFGPDQRDFVLSRFRDQVHLMVRDAAVWMEGNWTAQRATIGSALEMNKVVGGDVFDSIIFSPPYANRFDYFESMKVELWFGNFVNSYAEARRLRKSSLRSHLGADLAAPTTLIPELESLIELMNQNASSWRMRVPELLRGYFHDMFTVLSQCRKLLAHGGRCFVVVGNSAYAGVIVPTDALIALLGMEAGFERSQLLEVRHLTVAPQQRLELYPFLQHMRESIVVLE